MVKLIVGNIKLCKKKVYAIGRIIFAMGLIYFSQLILRGLMPAD